MQAGCLLMHCLGPSPGIRLPFAAVRPAKRSLLTPRQMQFGSSSCQHVKQDGMADADNHPTECDPSRPDILRLLEQDFLQTHDRIAFTLYRSSAGMAANTFEHDAAQRSTQHQTTIDEDRMRQVRDQMVQRAMDSVNTSRTTIDVNIKTER